MIEGHHRYCSCAQIWSLKEKMREKISASGGMISDGMGEGTEMMPGEVLVMGVGAHFGRLNIGPEEEV
jgi:hypothetical protein